MTATQILSLIGFPSLCSALVGFLIAKVRQNRAETQSVKLGVQALLRDRLLMSYHYCMKQGSASDMDRANFENMYQQYHQLGMNGVMDNIHERFMNLPIKED